MDEPPVNLQRPELWSQLQNAATLRASEDQVLWNIFGIFWAANALLLVALFTSGKPPSAPLVGIVISAVGLSLSFVWYFIQRRSLGHIRRHERLMERIERELRLPPPFAISADVNREDYDLFLRSGPRARMLMPACSLVGLLLWAITLGIFLCQAA